MRTLLLGICIIIASSLAAQRECATTQYMDLQKIADPASQGRKDQIENFIRVHTLSTERTEGEGAATIRIPVVVHILYKTVAQNISDAQIQSQLDALNRDFRRQNADTVNTPSRFKARAADMQVEFFLATADPDGRATKGIVRKSTTVSEWKMDDRIKFSSSGGSDAWDTRYYLNIWVGNLGRLLGYSSYLGGAANKDGLVINLNAFGTTNVGHPYDMGRTVVHETGHWLGLKHIWGDTYCGDDGVEDTPQQGNFTTGCPTAFRSSCNNGTLGDMYMNYMDYTNDACMNLFTEGQKSRVHALFAAGGARQSLLFSKGLHTPWNFEPPAEIPVVVESRFRFYPNPVRAELTLDFGNNAEWTGKTISIVNGQGAVVARIVVNGKTQKLATAQLTPGLYFIQGENGSKKIREKFVKL